MTADELAAAVGAAAAHDTLRSVMELRTSYERDEPELRRRIEPLRRSVKGRRK